MNWFLSFGRCPACKSHIFGSKLIMIPSNNKRTKWYKLERKVNICPVCGVKIVKHPVSRFMWVVILILITFYDIYFETYIKGVFGENFFTIKIVILSSLAGFGLFGMWCFGYELEKQ